MVLRELNLRNVNEVFNCKFSDDEFTIENLLDKKILQYLGFKDTIIYNYDSVASDNIENVDIQLDNIMEAIFFSENREMRIFSEEGKFRGSIFKEDNVEESDFIEDEYILYKRNSNMKKYPKKLKVKKYIDYDEDKQAYISYVKPCKFIY